MTASKTRVVNMRREPFDVYIGRPGRGERGTFGNPYRVGATCERCGKFHATAGETLPCYEAYLLERLEQDAKFCSEFFALEGKTLGCFCKPGPLPRGCYRQGDPNGGRELTCPS